MCILNSQTKTRKKCIYILQKSISTLSDKLIQFLEINIIHDTDFFLHIQQPTTSPHLPRLPAYPPKVIIKASPSGPMLSISRNVRPCVRLSVCLFVRLFTFEVPFKRLFAPTSRSRMSKIFRESESLGKSNGKKWSQI